MKLTRAFTKIQAALWSLALLCGAQQALAHGVQVAYGTTPTGFVRIYIEHWHGSLSPSSLGPSDNINVTVTSPSGTNTFNVNASGTVNNTAVGSLPGLVGPITVISTGSDSNLYNNWGYWDFSPGSCNQPISITINAGNSVIFAEYPSTLYPVTIAAQTFTDQAGPVITAPNLLVAGGCTGANVNFGVTVVDDCDPSPTVTYSHASGSFFPVGTTVVTVTATDNTGKTSVKNFSVTVYVNDTTPPSLTVPGPIVVGNSPGVCGANVSFTTTGTDDCSAVTIVNTPASGSFFAVGTTTVTSVATDGSGNATTKTFTVTVNDVTPPTVTVPASIVVGTAPGVCNAVVTFTVTPADNCPGVTVVSLPASGTTFPKGTTTVTSTATDAAGNVATKTFTVTVQDNEVPKITAPAAAKTFECDGSGNVAALSAWLASNGGAAASDNCGAVTWAHNFTALSDGCGATGSAIVVFTATDGSGNSATTAATFTITDTKVPVISTAAANKTFECDVVGNAAALSAWLASNGGAVATDVCGTVIWSNNFTGLSDLCGATGAATVTFTATDECGNATTTVATFTIADTKAPVISTAAANKTVECDGAGNTAALSAWLASNGGATASDTCGTVKWSHNFTALSDLCAATGTAAVTFTVTDECGNTSTSTATFTIVDTTSPVLTSNVRDILPNEAPITFTVSATDICGSATPTITSVTAHAINGAGKVVDKSGSTVIVIAGNKVTIVNSGGVGTFFTIYAAAVDECGNKSTATYVVKVLRPANEGVGNGVDGNTPGHNNNGGNDDPGFTPGNPGAKSKNG